MTVNLIQQNLIVRTMLLPLIVSMSMLSACSVSEPVASTTASTEIGPDDITADNLCITETEGFGPGGITLTAPECKTTQELANWLQGYSVFLGVIAVGCGVAPEPLVTKGTAALFAGASTVSGAASFIIQNMECDGPVELSEGTEKAIIKLMCEKSGKTYTEDGGPDGEPGCVD